MSSKTPQFDAALDRTLTAVLPHTRVCEETGQSSEIGKTDLEMCRSLRVPLPRTAWPARMRQKRSFMSGFSLFRRSLPDGRSVITLYDPESFAKFLPSEEWYSDAFDPMIYGQELKTTESFFEQWDRLSRLVPRPALIQDSQSENSAWSIYFLNIKNCYNCWGSWNSEDLLYSERSGESNHSSDLGLCHSCEGCYECVLCKHCAQTSFSERCEDCVNVDFSLGCRGCSDCFGCTNLYKKRFCFLNEQLTEEAYRAKRAAIDLSDHQILERWRVQTQTEWDKAFRLGSSIQQSERAEGDDIQGSRDASGITLYSVDHVYNSMFTNSGISSYDSIGGLEIERCYNDLNSVRSYENRMTNWCWDCLDVEYSELLTGCEHCFGCIGLTKKRFCIFNKQYTEEEYWRLVDLLKTAMLARGEYGEFFPHKYNPLAYNNSHAMAIFPLEEEKARHLGMRWYSFTEEKNEKAESMQALPERLAEIDDTVLTRVFRCPVTGQAFRYVKPELAFHRQRNIALPRVHPIVRRYHRAAQQLPYYLNQRLCDSCQTPMLTRLPVTITAPVLCQTCYDEVLIENKTAPNKTF